MPKKIYVMLSGGVDSSVAAFVLQSSRVWDGSEFVDTEIYGVYMRCWSKEQLVRLNLDLSLYACNWEDDLRDAQAVAKKLGIKFEVWDFEAEYLSKVVKYMLNEYEIGRTPNPDVMCNFMIKFGIFYDKAMSLGADYVASGHYARISNNRLLLLNGQFNNLDESNLIANSDLIQTENDALKNSPHKGRLKAVLPWELPEGLRVCSPEEYPKTQNTYITRSQDELKDQSYFLWKIPKNYLKHLLFPVGEFSSKAEVRKIAEQNGLITATKKDSQGLCFVGQTPLRELLKQKLQTKPGLILGSGLSDSSSEKAEITPENVNHSIINKSQLSKKSKIYNLENLPTEFYTKTSFKNEYLELDNKLYPILGIHPGAILYTRGQREKLGLAGGPWFVSKTDPKNNLVFVVNKLAKKSLDSNFAIIKNLNWQFLSESMFTQVLSGELTDSSILKCKYELNCQCQIRYHSQVLDCKIVFSDLNLPNLENENYIQSLITQLYQFPSTNQLKVEFLAPAGSVTAGQSIVFYKGEIMLGGGVVVWTLPKLTQPKSSVGNLLVL